MINQKDAFDQLERYAKAIARNLLFRYDLEFDQNRIEDIAQSLLLAGWQVWRDTSNLELAKHRMSSRAVNEEKKLQGELKQPQPLSSLNFPNAKDHEGTDDTEQYHDESGDMQFRRLRRGAACNSNQAEELIVQEYLNRLTERQRQIVQFRMAGFSDVEIAAELKISVRTVERELLEIRKDYEHEHAS